MKKKKNLFVSIKKFDTLQPNTLYPTHRMLCRTVIKKDWIFMTLWSLDRDFEKYDKVLIALHWCPSHPFDHIPYHFEKFFEKWYIVLFPNYYGTRWSDGICDFDNCTDTIVDLISLIKNKPVINEYNNTTINLQNKEILLVWASFGWYIALTAWGQSEYIKNIIACSPITDIDNHNSHNDEANLVELAHTIQTTYSNLRRCSKTWLSNLASWKLKYKKHMIQQKLLNKNVLILHWDNDPQIKSCKSEQFIQEMQNIWQWYYEYVNIPQWWHILLHNLYEEWIYKHVENFLEKIV